MNFIKLNPDLTHRIYPSKKPALVNAKYIKWADSFYVQVHSHVGIQVEFYVRSLILSRFLRFYAYVFGGRYQNFLT